MMVIQPESSDVSKGKREIMDIDFHGKDWKDADWTVRSWQLPYKRREPGNPERNTPI